MDNDTIFTKIIKGELPSHKIYEDDLTVAFMPLRPHAITSVLVVPKIQIDAFYDLPEKDYIALMKTVKKVAKRMEEVVDAKRIGVQIEGLDVPHAHVHVLAFNDAKDFNYVESDENPVDNEKLAEVAKKLAF